MSDARSILHADMDAFYASVEQRDDPSLRGRPVAVGGAPPRGVVAAASYEARRFGVHSAMPSVRALQRCPELVFLRPRMSHYAEISGRVMSILRACSPLVEPLSLDEAFVDLTGTEKLQGSAEAVARRIKRRVRDELDLVVSVGLGPSKLVAKIASDLGKPDGLVIVRADEVERFLRPLPISRLLGVGKVTERQLASIGIETIGQLATYPRELLRERCGASSGEHLWALSRGIDDRPVIVEQEPKSIGHENTFERDVDDAGELAATIKDHADKVARRLRARGLQATVIVLKHKSADFQLKTRRRSLRRPTSDGLVIGEVARELLSKMLRAGAGPARLIGVSATGLRAREAPRQLTFEEPASESGERLARALDEIAAKFGDDVLTRGRVRNRPDDGDPERGRP